MWWVSNININIRSIWDGKKSKIWHDNEMNNSLEWRWFKVGLPKKLKKLVTTYS